MKDRYIDIVIVQGIMCSSMHKIIGRTDVYCQQRLLNHISDAQDLMPLFRVIADEKQPPESCFVSS